MKKPEHGNAAAPEASQSVGMAASGFSPSLVLAINAAVQTIPLPPGRIDELRAELGQFQDATIGNRSRLDFDIEPACFVVSQSRPGKTTD